MGLGGEAIEAIGREHAYRPISGDVVFIGRQTTYFTPSELEHDAEKLVPVFGKHHAPTIT
jgi:hypothetical protein